LASIYFKEEEMKLEAGGAEARGIKVTIIQDGETKYFSNVERISLKSPSDFLVEVSESDNENLKKMTISYEADTTFQTNDMRRIHVFLKDKYSGSGAWLEVGMDSVDEKGKPIGGSYCRLEGKWVKNKHCPHCNKELTERKEFFIEI